MTTTQPNLDKFMIRVQGNKMYLSVAGRLVWFRQEHEDWGIVTAIVEINHEKQYAIFRTTIYDADGRMRATATKKEDVKGFGDYIEKAETGSIGRALNLCGFGTDDMDEPPPVNAKPQPMNAKPQQQAPQPATRPAPGEKPSAAAAAEYRRKAANVFGRWAKDIQAEWQQYIKETYDAGSIEEVDDDNIYGLWAEVVAAQKESAGVASPEKETSAKEASANP